jgi:thiol-disulfide isomerase/thioredoxin
MPPQKQSRYNRYRKTRKGNRIRKRHYPKTARGHRQSTSGRIFPPLDVRSPKQLNEVMKRISNGPVTVLVVYADWCGHCHKLMPHVKNAGNMANRNAQLISVNDEMLSRYNNTVNSVNRNASPIEVDGYPSVLLIDRNGKKLSEIAPTEQALNSAMVNVSPVAVEAGLAPSNSLVSTNKREMVKPRNGSPEEIMENVVENELVSPNHENNMSAPASFEHLSNDEIISEEPIETNSLAKSPDAGVSPMINSIRFSTNANASRPSKGTVTQSVPMNAVSGTKSKNNGLNNISLREAEEITSLQAAPEAVPVSPDIRSDVRTTKVSGGKIIGGGRGGSLYGIMSQTAYRLAPTAVLLATAAAVMKRNTRGKKKHGTKKRRHYSK